METSTLRPGLLVSLKTSLSGNVKYERKDIVRPKRTKDGKEQAKWETERTISDAAEYEAATKTRGLASNAIRRVCAKSAFGLLCPENDAPELEKAVSEARDICDAFNKKAKLTRVHVFVITGRIAPDDLEAVKAIKSEVSDLLKDMQTGVKNLDAKAIRDAANKARSVGAMLTRESSVNLQMAIDAARKAAREITKAGEQAAVEVDRRAIRTITECRTAFLDLDEAKEIAKTKASGRAVDLAPTEDSPKPKRREKARALELE